MMSSRVELDLVDWDPPIESVWLRNSVRWEQKYKSWIQSYLSLSRKHWLYTPPVVAGRVRQESPSVHFYYPVTKVYGFQKINVDYLHFVISISFIFVVPVPSRGWAALGGGISRFRHLLQRQCGTMLHGVRTCTPSVLSTTCEITCVSVPFECFFYTRLDGLRISLRRIAHFENLDCLKLTYN